MKKFEKENGEHYSRVNAIRMKWWRTSEEIMMEKGLMKMKCMGISLNGWFGHENGWKRKKMEVKMDEKERKWKWKWMGCHGFGERTRTCAEKINKRKRRITTRDQVASRLLSSLGSAQAASRLGLAVSRLMAAPLHKFYSPAIFYRFQDHFVIPKHLKSQFNTWFIILNIQKMINSN